MHGTEYGLAIVSIRQRILKLTADWLRDQVENGFDGDVETILDGLPVWDFETFDLMLSEGQALAKRLDEMAGPY